MTTKERAIRVIEELPEHATLDEIVQKLWSLEPEQEVGASGGQAPEAGAWDVLRSATGAVEMPADWASEHDHYLYGAPRRSSAA